MDVDNDLVDQHLLQQFSCMGTTDKEELVRQMQKLAGDNMNATTASFFLDMNNWNLQAAVCSYFDFESPSKLPSMILVCDEISEGSVIFPPATKFNKVWMIQNNGEENWPIGCYLQFAGGDRMTNCERIPAPALGVRCTVHLSVELTTPDRPGTYQSKWRMVTPTGSYFGDIIWMIVTVSEESTTSELTQQLSHLTALGSPSPQYTDSSRLNNPFGMSNHIHFQDSVQHMKPPDSENKMC